MSVPGTVAPRESIGPEADRVYRFEHSGRAGELVPIALGNAILSLVTLTIYRFWAKTRVRRYLWGRTSLLGDDFEYTGTGGELFKGFLAALFLALLPLGLLSAAMGLWIAPGTALDVVSHVCVFLLVIFLVGVALYRARRYRFSRTVWRGVRAGQTGSSVNYGLKYFAFTLLLPVTLGWSYPWQSYSLMRQAMENSWFGDRRFTFDGGMGPLYRRFALFWLVVAGLTVASFVVTALVMEHGTTSGDQDEAVRAYIEVGAGLHLPLISVIGGLGFIWYKAGEIGHFARCTSFEGLSFSFDAGSGSLLWLWFGNLLISVFTLGLGYPFAQMRTFRYVCDRLAAAGTTDLDAIVQNADTGPGIGEGLADAFDVGAV